MSESVKAAAPRVPCTLCDKDYVNKQGLKHHMTKTHTVSKETTTVASATEDTTTVAPATDNITKVASATDDTPAVPAAPELEDDNDVMIDAKEEQDLYDSLDDLVREAPRKKMLLIYGNFP